MKKRLLCIVLVFCMLMTLSFTALASEGNAETAALTLHELGLFRGDGDNADGTPNFALERTPNRAESLVMLIRLLGKEEAALAGTWETPFTDVPDWAAPYVGYAYANALTKGTGATTFGGALPVSATQYLTFVLRALGYSSESDFRWDAAWEKTDALGITNGEYGAEKNEVTRGDMAIISADSLNASIRGEETTLIEKLVEDGAVDAKAAAAQGYLKDSAGTASMNEGADETPEEPDSTGTDSGITKESGENGLIIHVTNQAGLKQAVKQSEKVAEISIEDSFTVTEDSGVSYAGELLEYYADVVMTIQEGVTLTIAEGGEIGIYWFSYEGDWETGTLPNGRFVNHGTLIVERDGWVNGEFTENHGSVLVRDGGQCQTIPNLNTGSVVVLSGGSYRTTQGQEAVNKGSVTVEAGANIVSRFGSTIVNEGELVMDGLLSVGYVFFANEDHEELWFRNSGTVSGTGTVRVYDAFGEQVDSETQSRMEALILAELGSAAETLSVEFATDTGV